MRGTVFRKISANKDFRITPAHAGNRCKWMSRLRQGWDHPRTCGEQKRTRRADENDVGSPPHMRGTAEDKELKSQRIRITPAHAGNRRERNRTERTVKDHPRTCGEQLEICNRQWHNRGSPPHMRGTEENPMDKYLVVRITPAHAGNSGEPAWYSSQCWDHPRTCGEQSLVFMSYTPPPGSPPHMRGTAKQMLPP